jgi:hypothetical protein
MTTIINKVNDQPARVGRRRRGLAAVAAITGLSGIGSVSAAIQFDEVSATAGMLRAGESFGAAWGDLNGDGFPDLAVPNHRGRPNLYVNRGDGSFVNMGNQVRTWTQDPTADTHGATWMDADNDGDQDLLVSVGSANPSQLLINEFGELVDRSAERGLRYDKKVTVRLPVWLDYNADTWPDLLMVNHRSTAPIFAQTAGGFHLTNDAVGMTCAKFHYAQLYDVNGDNRLDLLCSRKDSSGGNRFPLIAYDTGHLPFRDITGQTLPIPKALDTAIADFDGDLREDIFAVRGILRPSGVGQQGRVVEALLTGGAKGFQLTSAGRVSVDIHWNRSESDAQKANIKIGAGGFKPSGTTFSLDPNSAEVVGAPSYTSSELPLITIGYDATRHEWTFNNISGRTFSNAYFIVRSDAAITALRGVGLWPSDGDTAPFLLLNESLGPVDRTRNAGLAIALSCISTVAGDFDNDMDVDIYAACRSGPRNIANVVFENRGHGRFVALSDIGDGAGPVGLAVTGGAGTADTVVAADYDVDGFLDLYVSNGFNMRPLNSGGPETLLRNRGNDNHWMEIDLVATHSMRDALGARVFVTAGGVTQLRTANGSYHRWAQDSKRLHFGLADNTRADVEVRWPSGAVSTFTDVTADNVYRIREGASSQRSALQRVALGQGQPLPCGAPSIKQAGDSGVFVWKDCNTGRWQLRALAADSTARYTGQLAATAALIQVRGIGLEESDVLDADPAPERVAFSYDVARRTRDGMQFKLADATSACLDVQTESGRPRVFYGPLRADVTLPFDLRSGGACS